MAMVCEECGSYGRGAIEGRVLRCEFCGVERIRPDLPLLIVTGVPASGKSIVCSALAKNPRVLAVDGDTLSAGAQAVADGRKDYLRFWKYLWSIALEVHDNGLVPVFCTVALPEQVLAARGSIAAPVHFLALTADDHAVRARIVQRRGASDGIDVDRHLRLNAQLRGQHVESPDTFTVVDTARLSPAETIAEAEAWCARVV